MTSNPADSPEPATPAAQDAPIAIVAGHAEFADGLISAVEKITGRGARLVSVSNRGLGPAEIEATMRAAADATSVRVIFTDLPAGSCTIAARRLLRDRPDLRLVTGANLPAVIDYVLSVDVDADPSDALAHAVDRGRGALTVFAPPTPAAAPPLAVTTAATGPGPEVGGAR
jgi:PTS system N-acetylgalactosamine-specific IIA component